MKKQPSEIKNGISAYDKMPLGGIPSQNLEAEQACLGACLLDSEALYKVAEIVDGPHDFYRIAHQEIYSAMISLLNQDRNVDIITVCEVLRQQDKLEPIGGASYLDHLTSSVACSAHVVTYAQIVADTAIERRLQQTGSAIVSLAFDGELGAKDKLDRAEELLFSVSYSHRKNGLLPLETTLKDTFTELYDSFLAGNMSTGLPTGWIELDSLIGGLQEGNLIVVGARPSMGKTAFCLELARHVAMSSRDEAPNAVAIFSLEMSRTEIQQRLLCASARINNMDLRRGRMSDADWQRIARATNSLSNAPIYIDDQPGLSVLDIKSQLRKICKHTNLRLVIIDYLQLMRGTSFGGGMVNRVQEISEITRQLKCLAKELSVPIVALSQLSRNLESRQDKRPIMADLRESGSIEQDADLIAFLYREAYYNPVTPEGDTVEVIVAKQRNGPVDTVKLEFVKTYGRFENIGNVSPYNQTDIF